MIDLPDFVHTYLNIPVEKTGKNTYQANICPACQSICTIRKNKRATWIWYCTNCEKAGTITQLFERKFPKGKRHPTLVRKYINELVSDQQMVLFTRYHYKI